MFCLSALATAKLAVLRAKLEKHEPRDQKLEALSTHFWPAAVPRAMLSIRIPPRLCSNNVFRKFLQCGFREKLEANYREYTNFWVEHSARQNWVQLGPALGKSHFSNFVRPQFCGIPPCLAHTHHTCPSKRPGQMLAYPRRLQKLNTSRLFDIV